MILVGKTRNIILKIKSHYKETKIQLHQRIKTRAQYLVYLILLEPQTYKNT